MIELEAALGVKQRRPDEHLLAANVIAEEPSGLKRAIAIDRGLSDGIDEGMVVLSRERDAGGYGFAGVPGLRLDPADYGPGECD